MSERELLMDEIRELCIKADVDVPLEVENYFSLKKLTKEDLIPGMAFKVLDNEPQNTMWFYKLDFKKFPNAPIVLTDMEGSTYCTMDEIERDHKRDNKKRMDEYREKMKNRTWAGNIHPNIVPGFNCPRRLTIEDSLCDHEREDGTCSYCGGLLYDKIIELIDEGWRVCHTDKNYKVYLMLGFQQKKVYIMHFDKEQIQVFNRHLQSQGES